MPRGDITGSSTIRVSRLRHAVVYAGVAALATAADVLTVTLCRRAAGAPLLLAVAAGFAANVTVGFLLQRLVVFPHTRRSVRSASWRYAVLVVSNVLIGVGGVTLAVGWGAPYLAARIASSAVIVVLNYAALRTWVFPGPRVTA